MLISVSGVWSTCCFVPRARTRKDVNPGRPKRREVIRPEFRSPTVQRIRPGTRAREKDMQTIILLTSTDIGQAEFIDAAVLEEAFAVLTARREAGAHDLQLIDNALQALDRAIEAFNAHNTNP